MSEFRKHHQVYAIQHSASLKCFLTSTAQVVCLLILNKLLIVYYKMRQGDLAVQYNFTVQNRDENEVCFSTIKGPIKVGLIHSQLVTNWKSKMNSVHRHIKRGDYFL